MVIAYYLVCRDLEQAQRIKDGASVASALAVCDTYNEARQIAVEYVDENPDIDIYAVYNDPHQPDLEVIRRVSWAGYTPIHNGASHGVRMRA